MSGFSRHVEARVQQDGGWLILADRDKSILCDPSSRSGPIADRTDRPGYCRRNPKLHCESDAKCLLCGRFAASANDLPRFREVYERFQALGLGVKAVVVAAQI